MLEKSKPALEKFFDERQVKYHSNKTNFLLVESKDPARACKFLKDNNLPYFYWSYKDLDDIGYDSVDKALDMKHMNLRIQIYIKCKAKVNISNQCGANHLAARYSDCYEVQRQFPIAHNFIEGETYL